MESRWLRLPSLFLAALLIFCTVVPWGYYILFKLECRIQYPADDYPGMFDQYCVQSEKDAFITSIGEIVFALSMAIIIPFLLFILICVAGIFFVIIDNLGSSKSNSRTTNQNRMENNSKPELLTDFLNCRSCRKEIPKKSKEEMFVKGTAGMGFGTIFGVFLGTILAPGVGTFIGAGAGAYVGADGYKQNSDICSDCCPSCNNPRTSCVCEPTYEENHHGWDDGC